MPTTAHIVVYPEKNLGIRSGQGDAALDAAAQSILGDGYNRSLFYLFGDYNTPLYPGLWESAAHKSFVHKVIPCGESDPLVGAVVNMVAGREYHAYTATNCIFPSLGFPDVTCFRNSVFTDCVFISVGNYREYPLFLECSFENCIFIALQFTDGNGNARGGIFSFGNCTFDTPDIPEALQAYDHFDPMVIPREGAFTMWKKLRGTAYGSYIVCELFVPETAERVRGAGEEYGVNNKKIRVSEAVVVGITRYVHDDNMDIVYTQDLSEGESIHKAYINHDYAKPLAYVVGTTVVPNTFDPSSVRTCTNGIHGFLDKQEAINY